MCWLQGALDLGGDGAGGGLRIVGGGDGTADDEVVGSGADGILGSDNARLVSGNATGRTDSGRDEGESCAESMAQARGFLGRGNDAATSGAESQSGESENLRFDIIGDANFDEIGRGERGEDGYGQHGGAVEGVAEVRQLPSRKRIRPR